MVGKTLMKKQYKKTFRTNVHGFPDLITKHKSIPRHITEISEHSRQREDSENF